MDVNKNKMNEQDLKKIQEKLGDEYECIMVGGTVRGEKANVICIDKNNKCKVESDWYNYDGRFQFKMNSSAIDKCLDIGDKKVSAYLAKQLEDYLNNI